MTLVVNKKISKQKMEEMIDHLKPAPKVFNAKKFFGKIKIKGDPLKIQREMRNE